MIEYLKSDEAKKPTTIASAPKKQSEQAGCVTTDIAHGDLFLHPEGEKTSRVRMRWEPGRGGARELPPGTYQLSGYRHVAEGKDGATWIWSTTSPAYRKLEVKAGESVHVEVRRKIGVSARAFTKKGKHRVGLVFMAEKRLGNTLYRKGRRIAIEWQCLDEKDAVLSKGTMRYG